MWKPNPTLWKNEEVFIYGGGSSLEDWDNSPLLNELVVGCNDAYKYGPMICDVCMFGDFKWFNLHHIELKKYVDAGGIAVTNECKITQTNDHRWVKKMQRERVGLSKTALGWNANTGASALNLALILGASTVYLLGFDMKLIDGKGNWHPNPLDKPKQTIYDRMMKNFKIVAQQLPKIFPNCKVFNVTNNSKLEVFPKLGFDEFWSNRNELSKQT